MSLQPNKPINRFRHVVKTYANSKVPVVVTATASVALWLTGADRSIVPFWSRWRWLNDDAYYVSFETRPAGAEIVQATRQRIEGPHTWAYEAARGEGVPPRGSAWEGLDAWMAEHLPAQHPLDFVIPWAARELGRLAKEVRKKRADDVDWDTATERLSAKATAIGMWARDEKIDLSKTTLAEAFEAIEDYEVDTGEPVPQGEVVHAWDDGWTVQELGPDELEAEGEVMQHCVGSYCAEVTEGDVQVFSLRDPRGRPHATIEYVPDINRFVQVQGKQNEPPKSAYQKRIDEWAQVKGVAPADALTDDEDANVRVFAEQFGAEAWDKASDDHPDFNIIDAEVPVGIDVDVEEVVQGALEGDPAKWYESGLEDLIEATARDAAEDRWREIQEEQMAELERLAEEVERNAEAEVAEGNEPDVEGLAQDAFNYADNLGSWGSADFSFVVQRVKDNLRFVANPGPRKLWSRAEAERLLSAFGRSFDGIDEKQFRRGIVVEMEHTKSPVIAAKIALDHLDETRDYYTRLDAMEAAAEE